MTQQRSSPFARVPNGYDPEQVAAFAAEALSWKKELRALRAELEAAGELVSRYESDRYESEMGTIEDAEREASALVEDGERRAAEIIEDARERASKIVEAAEREASAICEIAPGRLPEVTGKSAAAPEPMAHDPREHVAWLARPDPVEEIFEPIDEEHPVDAETERERRIAAATANLWKRRGVLAPPE